MSVKPDQDEVVCEFFGIKITTKNPNIARILTSDIGEVLNRDIRQLTTGSAPGELADTETDDPESED